MKKKSSLKDIAAYLGVSTTLVSYVINNKEKEAGVSKEMARKIRQAAKQLNYQPNLIAKSLKSGRTNTIGLVVADISNPFFSAIARIIEDEAGKYGYAAIFGSNDESAEKSATLINVLQSRQVDAFIIAAAEKSEEQIQGLQAANIPVVLIDRYFPSLDIDRVFIDNYQAAYKATQHLIRSGRTRVAMLAYDTGLYHMEERVKGYRDALRDHNLSFRKTWLRWIGYRQAKNEARQTMSDWLKPSVGIDAVLFATNTLAVESLKYIAASGVRVPERLAIIAFDESEAYDFFYSPVSSIRQPIEEMGKAAVRLVIERLGQPDKPTSAVGMDALLVLRESSDCSLMKKND